MKRFLVAFDGSEGAQRAARLAAEWAGPLGGSVELVHAVALLPMVAELGEESVATLTRGYEAYAQRILDEGRALLAGTGVSVQTRLVQGGPAEVIAELAKADDVALVVVGGGARGLLSRALLGSVTLKVLHHSPKPVLVAR